MISMRSRIPFTKVFPFSSVCGKGRRTAYCLTTRAVRISTSELRMKRFFPSGPSGGLMNYYFIYDNTPLDIISAYTRLTGTPELPPLWALGYHQSKWSYYPDKAVYNLVERFRGMGIPCDAVHLDHHYMERKGGIYLGQTEFSRRGRNGPRPGEGRCEDGSDCQSRREGQFRQSGLERGDGTQLFLPPVGRQFIVGGSMAGTCNFPDFTAPAVRGWWADLFSRDIGKIGVRGLWNDMNEPVVFRTALSRWIRGMNMTACPVPMKRPIIFTGSAWRKPPGWA